MGLFSGVLSGAKKYPSNEPEAILGILLAVIAADGDISEDEGSSFMYLANHTRALGPMPPSVFKSHVDTCLSLLRSEGASALMERCSAHVNQQSRQPLFVNACDLIMRDGRVEPEEERLIEDLQRRLGIDNTFAQNAVSIVLCKYSL